MSRVTVLLLLIITVRADPSALTLTVNETLTVPALFFDRGSTTAVVMGQGLPASKESMLVFAKLFTEYDIILFDYRWNNCYYTSLVKSVIRGGPLKNILFDEEAEIRAALQFLQRRKQYTRIVGLGECYSCFLFAKIQADDIQKHGKGPFTHLIFDSPWLSLKTLAESIYKDPYLPLYPQEGGAPWWLKKFSTCPLIKKVALGIIFRLMKDVSIKPYLSKLNIPLLLVHGSGDQLVPQEHFEEIQNAAPQGKLALLLTERAHAENIHEAPAYQYAVTHLLEEDAS